MVHSSESLSLASLRGQPAQYKDVRQRKDDPSIAGPRVAGANGDLAGISFRRLHPEKWRIILHFHRGHLTRLELVTYHQTSQIPTPVREPNMHHRRNILLWFSASLILGGVRLVAAEVSQQPPARQPSIVVGAKSAQEEAAQTSPATAAASKSQLIGKGPQVQWIWGPKPKQQSYFLRKEFEAQSDSAVLIATCDNQMTVWLNGTEVAKSTSWERPVLVDVSKAIKRGKNTLLVEAGNQGGVAGFALKLVAGSTYVVSDASWSSANLKDSANWGETVKLASMGASPWGDVFRSPKQSLPSSTPRNVFQLQAGFQVDLLYTVPRDQQGSWVSMAFDNKGRIIASDQGGKGLYRITPSKLGTDEPTRVEKLDVAITSAHGLLYAFESLYVSVNGGPGSGLYRLRDTNGDDQYDERNKLMALRGGGEHGPHAVRLSPDGKSLYVIAGNHTDPPKYNAKRLAGRWDEDLLLPRQWDARGHARGKLAPGGWIAKTDPEGKQWEIISIGYRNPYDMDFNVDGELFAYDADMEWDMGSPWYRPTRVVHATSGSEFGWRSGTGKWPTYFVDSLPPTVEIGPGSPVGATFGYGAKFPAKYQRALYILDWTFGTIYAIHMTPQGASYVGQKEEFLSRTPLPLTDADVGPDGALYFTVGGRNTQSALYRVTYSGDEPTTPAVEPDSQFASLRASRRLLETYHRQDAEGAKAIPLALEHLHNQDRHIRYAARTALEHQDVATWRDQVLDLQDAKALITGCVALARSGVEADQPLALEALARISFGGLTETQQLELLRAYALVFIRLKPADRETSSTLVKSLAPHYPAKSNRVNRELSRLLVYLNSPTVVGKTLELMHGEKTKHDSSIPELLSRNPGYGGTIAQMLANMPDLQKLHYAFMLRNMKFGWTLEERRSYFAWLAKERSLKGGASYQGFIDNIQKDALANATENERTALAASEAPKPPAEADLPKPIGPGRKWTTDEIVSLASNSLHGRDYQAGRRAFAAAKCISCHRFAGEGGATGPDLTNTAGRFSIRDVSESVVRPSRVISDQYRAMAIITDGGKSYVGRVISSDDKTITIMADPVDATKIVVIDRDEIESMQPSRVSLMPSETFDQLNEDEVLDLLAYLVSRGDPNSREFQGN